MRDGTVPFASKQRPRSVKNGFERTGCQEANHIFPRLWFKVIAAEAGARIFFN